MLSAIRQREKDTYRIISFMIWDLKKTELIGRENRLVVDRGDRGRRWMKWVKVVKTLKKQVGHSLS